MNDEQDRIKRPQPERVQPFRSWSTLLTGAPARTAADERRDDGTSGQRREQRADAPDPPSFNDVVARSVDIGYRVIDEYMRQGQKAAQRFSERSFGPDAVVNDVREVADRMAQQASEVLGLWFQFLEMVSASGVMRPMTDALDPTRATTPPSASPGAAAAENGARARPADAARVRVEVTSPYPTEVAVELRAAAGSGPYIVHALRAADADKPRLTEIALIAAPAGGDEGPRLRVRVPQDQPSGIYNGLIVDETTSRPVGTVSVRVARE